MTQTQPEVGSTANSYVILAKLATGGMAEIFLARNASAAGIERYVVLKRVLRNRANDANFVRMFLDEARLAAQLQHPNIAQVYDTGVLGDSYFFTMEYVHGETVREILHRTYALRSQIPIGCALTIVAGAAAGLHHAHERIGMEGKPLGIVHRDVSPSNLMVSFEGNVKVVDFGVAKATHNSVETQSGTVKGKISYMSPEQCRGKTIDRRSDLFSLGIVMWEMLVGERLFKKATDYDNMEAIVHSKVAKPSTVRPGVPADVDEIVMKLLARNADDRYQNADVLLEDIERVGVKVGVALSAAALGRFVKELFGQRPEPWIEMKAREALPAVVTVTSSPVGDYDSISASVEPELGAIPDLGSSSGGRVWPNTPRAATPSPAGVPPFAVMQAREARPFAATPPSGTPIAYPPTPTGTPSLRQTPTGTPVLRSPTPDASPAHPESWSQADAPAIPVMPRSSNRTIVFACVAAAVVIGGVVLFTTVRSHPSPRHAAVVADARTALALATPDAGALADPPADAMHVAAVPTDAASERTVARADAAVRIVAPPIDAAVEARLVEDPVVAPHPHPHEPTSDDLARAFRSSQFGEVVSLCGANPRLANQNTISCVLAACHLRDATKAKHWLANLPLAKQVSVGESCAGLGTSIVDKPSNCDTDPMSCRR